MNINWVKITTNTLPDDGKGVLITDGDAIGTAKRVGLFDGDFFWSPLHVTGYDLEWDMNVVTHWAELPELPDEN